MILQDMTQAQALERIAKLEAQLAAARGKLKIKVSEKGALSIYGMGRWPVTLYRGQMERLLEGAEQIRAFIDANADSLSVKE